MLLFNPWKALNNYKLHICLDFSTIPNMIILKDKSSSSVQIKK